MPSHFDPWEIAPARLPIEAVVVPWWVGPAFYPIANTKRLWLCLPAFPFGTSLISHGSIYIFIPSPKLLKLKNYLQNFSKFPCTHLFLYVDLCIYNYRLDFWDKIYCLCFHQVVFLRNIISIHSRCKFFCTKISFYINIMTTWNIKNLCCSFDTVNVFNWEGDHPISLKILLLLLKENSFGRFSVILNFIVALL